MSGELCKTPRVGWLDGLRGIAAIQVILLHYASAFLPAIGLSNPEIVHYQWERAFIGSPLFLPFDGYSAVYIFFVLSGIALTYSFSARPFNIATCVMRRVVRLGLPMALAIIFAGILFKFSPDGHVTAAALTGSEVWLGSVAPPPISMGPIVHQIGLEGMLAGYREPSLLPTRVGRLLGLVSLSQSYNSPLWTLHIEFYGSLLVLALVSLRVAAGRGWHLVACLILAGCFARSPIVLFMLGHLAAPWLRIKRSERNWHPALGGSLLFFGILLCTLDTLVIIKALWTLLPIPPFGSLVTSANLQRMFGAMLIFSGLLLLPRFQAYLEQPITRWLGKISFSLYLTHFPVIVTVSSTLFLGLVATFSYGVSVTIVCILGLGISIGIAIAFERCVDRPAIILSRTISLSNKNAKTIPHYLP